jgi:hypothetical protein
MQLESLRRLWQRATGPFKEFGAIAGTLYVADQLLRRLSPRLGLYVYELMVQPIGGKKLLPTNLAKNLTFAEIVQGHPAIELMPARPEIKIARFEQGAICLGVFRKEKLIGYAWFCFNAYEEDEVRCTYVLAVPGQSVFDFDFYILPEHRMGIGFAAVWHGANEYLRARDIRYTFSRVTRFNVASRRAHAHLGCKCVGKALFFQAWRVELMLATLAPFIKFSWSCRSRPRLRLCPDKLLAAGLGQTSNVS